MPAQDPERRLSYYKRLIVGCDGTWDDSTADVTEPPTNVTRILRGLSSNAIVEEDGIKKIIPQIVYYQKGVGTGFGEKLTGGAAGVGLSANVRAAYGFLANNYNDGDKIYFFGFSRGAYTARAIAGLVANLGLLTNRGMDNFSTVYNDYYNNKIDSYDDEKRKRLGFRPPLPSFTVELIGVWDTVGFHDKFSRWFGEELEFRNTLLDKAVRYAYHALGLDETRTAFQPVLWQLPEDSEGQEMLQVWFSGVHSDIGGGSTDPRLSNITLAWMIAQCTKHGQLSFDIDSYFFDHPVPAIVANTVPWATSEGQNKTPWSFTWLLEAVLGGQSSRRPLQYEKPEGGYNPPITNEYLHESINNRNCCGQSLTSTPWSTKVLKSRQDDGTWTLRDGKTISEIPLLDMEKYLKGRIRTVHTDKIDVAVNTHGKTTV